MIIDYKNRVNSRYRFPIDENGKKHGLFSIWYPNGNLSYELNYKDGKLHGLYRYWHPNGKLCHEENFRNGK